MTQSVMTSREFNQDTGRAKKAANNGPVIITDHGKPAHVLLSYDEFRRLGGKKLSIVDMISMPEGADLEIEFPRSRELPRVADLS